MEIAIGCIIIMILFSVIMYIRGYRTVKPKNVLVSEPLESIRFNQLSKPDKDLIPIIEGTIETTKGSPNIAGDEFTYYFKVIEQGYNLKEVDDALAHFRKKENYKAFFDYHSGQVLVTISK